MQVFLTSCSITTTARQSRYTAKFTCWFTIHLPTSWATYPAGLPPSFLSLEPQTSDTARLLSPWAICPVEPGCLLSDCGGGVPVWDRLMQNLHFSSVVWNHRICVAVRSLCAFVPIRKRTSLCHSCDRNSYSCFSRTDKEENTNLFCSNDQQRHRVIVTFYFCAKHSLGGNNTFSK